MASVKMPQLGESITEGTISKWLKQPGDQVKKYEGLVEIITDKVNAEVPAPLAGVLKEIKVKEGTTVTVGTEIAVIEESVAAGAPTPNLPREPGYRPPSAPSSRSTTSPTPSSPASRDRASVAGSARKTSRTSSGGAPKPSRQMVNSVRRRRRRAPARRPRRGRRRSR